MKHYPINESFLSLQGEGQRAGSLNVFLRFAGCNLTCSRNGEAGFDCDTEFVSHSKASLIDVAGMVAALWPASGGRPSIILTGGEPLLHLDAALVGKLLEFEPEVLALETNGTIPLPSGVDRDKLWISCSPKSAEHTLRIGVTCDELRYVRHSGHGIPKPNLVAPHLFLSPAWDVDPYKTRRNLEHCIELVNRHPEWRLSVQQHKLWGLR